MSPTTFQLPSSHSPSDLPCLSATSSALLECAVFSHTFESVWNSYLYTSSPGKPCSSFRTLLPGHFMCKAFPHLPVESIQSFNHSFIHSFKKYLCSGPCAKVERGGKKSTQFALYVMTLISLVVLTHLRKSRSYPNTPPLEAKDGDLFIFVPQ